MVLYGNAILSHLLLGKVTVMTQRRFLSVTSRVLSVHITSYPFYVTVLDRGCHVCHYLLLDVGRVVTVVGMFRQHRLRLGSLEEVRRLARVARRQEEQEKESDEPPQQRGRQEGQYPRISLKLFESFSRLPTTRAYQYPLLHLYMYLCLYLYLYLSVPI